MKPEFQVQCKIQRPVSEVFDAVYNPQKLATYFTTAGASAPLNPGTTVIWQFADFPGEHPVQVIETISNERIVLEWKAAQRDYNTRTVMTFEALSDDETLVKISEAGWQENDLDQKNAYDNCQGWTQMQACLKAYLEHGINLRKGYY